MTTMSSQPRKTEEEEVKLRMPGSFDLGLGITADIRDI
jgi:hypothetical protein